MNVLKRAEELGATFADLRYMKIKELSILFTEDREVVTSNGIDEGYNLRVLYKNNWGYTSTTDELTEDDVKNAIRSAIGDEKVNIVFLPPKRDEVRIKPKYYMPSIEEKFKDLKKLKEELLNLDSRVKSVNIRYYEAEIEKYYESTEDREIKQSYVISGLSINVTARENDMIASASYSDATLMGYPLEVFDLNGILNVLKTRLNNQFIGIMPKAGEYTVILAPEVVGVFAHEAVGHLAEADLAVNGILYPLRSQKIAPEIVNIIDSPSSSHQSAIGYTVYDDEGVEGRDVYIIKDGFVNEFLTDRYFSAYLGEKPSGNASAEDFRNPILIRMRNTYFAPGNTSYEEMIRETKDGLLLVSTAGGQTSPDGTFQFGIQEGYVIENGGISKPLKIVGISGYTIETLKNVKEISKTIEFKAGYCGKEGQSVAVSTGGPYVKVEKMKVGGLIG